MPPLSTSLVIAGLAALLPPAAGETQDRDRGIVERVQSRDDRGWDTDRDSSRDWDRDRNGGEYRYRDEDYKFDEKGWDRGGEGKGRRAATRREQRAIEFIQEFYKRATESTPDAYRFMAAAFAPEVKYYGKRRSREGVLADKFAWMERWPVRDYRVREDSAEWQCNENARLCVIRVLVDFDARNPATGKVSKGVTTNELGVRVTNSDVMIEYENGKVLKRR